MAEIFERFVSNEYGVLEVIFREKEKKQEDQENWGGGGGGGGGKGEEKTFQFPQPSVF